jgi:hypothetical protein
LEFILFGCQIFWHAHVLPENFGTDFNVVYVMTKFKDPVCDNRLRLCTDNAISTDTDGVWTHYNSANLISHNSSSNLDCCKEIAQIARNIALLLDNHWRMHYGYGLKRKITVLKKIAIYIHWKHFHGDRKRMVVATKPKVGSSRDG